MLRFVRLSLSCPSSPRPARNASSLKGVHSLNTTTHLLVCLVAVWNVVAQGLPVPRSLRDSKFRVAVSSSSVSTTRCRRASLLEPKESAPHPRETRGCRREREEKKKRRVKRKPRTCMCVTSPRQPLSLPEGRRRVCVRV